MAQNDVDQLFSAAAALPNGAAAAPALAQDDIDSMFGGAAALPNGTAVALDQDGIDDMFAAPRVATVPSNGPAGKSELGQDDVDRMFG